MIDNNDLIYKSIFTCTRNKNQPDLHSFTIALAEGNAYVDAQDNEIYMEIYRNNTKYQWRGTVLAAANKLYELGGDAKTIEM